MDSTVSEREPVTCRPILLGLEQSRIFDSATLPLQSGEPLPVYSRRAFFRLACEFRHIGHLCAPVLYSFKH